MSFTSEQLKEHCNRIIKEPNINNKIVVLCEGFFKDLGDDDALELKEQSENTQDASFYYQATPKEWRRNREIDPPEFFPCGSQQNVIEAFFYLKNIHKEKTPDYSYLETDKLFGLVDIDFKKDSLLKIKKKYSDISYPFNNLDDIYHDIYLDGKVNQETQNKHKLWVTGFLHKEAYFFIPQLQNIFDSEKIELEEKYNKILKGIPTSDFFVSKAIKRITHHQIFNQCKTLKEFQIVWKLAFNHNEITEIEKEQLIYALLTVAKSKSIWEEIKPNTTAKNKEIKEYRDNLSLRIASEFYAQQPQDSQLHLPSFFNALLANY